MNAEQCRKGKTIVHGIRDKCQVEVSTEGHMTPTKILVLEKGAFQGWCLMCEREFHTRFRAVLRHTHDLCWSLRERRRRNGAWPRNTQHPICQRRVYILDLETSWYIDCAFESAVLYFFHRIHHKAGV
jgi:hypothetical protein